MSEDHTMIRIPNAKQLLVGTSKVFPLPDSEEQGFLLQTEDGLRAYRNRCCHWPCPLDMEDGDFWNPEANAIQCKVHGALFKADNGDCVWGPCVGGTLKQYPVSLEGDTAVIEIATES